VEGQNNYSRRRRRRRRRSNLRDWTVVFLIIIGLVIVIWRFSTPRSTSKTISKGKTSSKTQTKASKPIKLEDYTFLAIGIEKNSTNTVTTLVQFLYHPEKKTIKGIRLNPQISTDIPGLGFGQLSQAYSLGAEVFSQSVGNFTSVRPRYYLVANSQRLRRIIKERSLEELVLNNLKSNLSRSQLLSLAKKIRQVDRKKIHFYLVPTVKVTIGEQTYYQIKRDKLRQLVSKIWGIKLATPVENRIIVLNGSGIPGSASEVANNLMKRGFRIIDTKNADNFNYQKTQIYIYGKQNRPLGEKIKEILGFGEIVQKQLPESVADVVVVVGNDYNQ
jgi:hypothetical protein